MRIGRVVENPSEELPASARRLLHERFAAVRTCGDGACAVHAVFGSVQNGELRCEGARELLQEKMRPLADARVRASLAAGRSMALVEEALWHELGRPAARIHAGDAAPGDAIHHSSEALAFSRAMADIDAGQGEMGSLAVVLEQHDALQSICE